MAVKGTAVIKVGTSGDLMIFDKLPSSVASGSQRIVWGNLYDDGDPLDLGSGDWYATSVSNNVMEIDIDPPFNTVPAVTIQAINQNNFPWDGTSTGYEYVSHLFGDSVGFSSPNEADKTGHTVIRKFTAASDGYYDSILFGYRLANSQTASVSARIYADSGGSPGAAATDVATGSTSGLTGFNIGGSCLWGSQQFLPAGDYWIAIAVVSSTASIGLTYSAGTGGSGFDLSGDTSLADPWPGGGSSSTKTWEFRTFGRTPGALTLLHTKAEGSAQSGFFQALPNVSKIGVVIWDKDGQPATTYIPFSFIAIGT